MTITITAVPVEIAAELSQKALDYITELVEDNYALDDILEFLNEFNSDDFIAYYVDYVEQGEKVGYDVVDAFIKENGIVNVEYCEDAFVGCADSEAAFVEDYLECVMEVEIPCWVAIDYQATWDASVRFDYDFIDGYVFRSDY